MNVTLIEILWQLTMLILYAIGVCLLFPLIGWRGIIGIFFMFAGISFGFVYYVSMNYYRRTEK